MANLIDEAENVVILSVVFAILAIFIWVLWRFRNFFFGKGGPGTSQSLQNALNGFPDGADPGSIPVFQELQGAIESARNFGDLIFGSNDEDEYSADQEAGITKMADSYQAPTQAQVNQSVQSASTFIQNGGASLDGLATEGQLF